MSQSRKISYLRIHRLDHAEQLAALRQNLQIMSQMNREAQEEIAKLKQQIQLTFQPARP